MVSFHSTTQDPILGQEVLCRVYFDSNPGSMPGDGARGQNLVHFEYLYSYCLFTTLPYPTLPYPTLPFPTLPLPLPLPLPYPTLPYPTPTPTLPYPTPTPPHPTHPTPPHPTPPYSLSPIPYTLPYPTLPYLTLPYPTLPYVWPSQLQSSYAVTRQVLIRVHFKIKCFLGGFLLNFKSCQGPYFIPIWPSCQV